MSPWCQIDPFHREILPVPFFFSLIFSPSPLPFSDFFLMPFGHFRLMGRLPVRWREDLYSGLPLPSSYPPGVPPSPLPAADSIAWIVRFEGEHRQMADWPEMLLLEDSFLRRHSLSRDPLYFFSEIALIQQWLGKEFFFNLFVLRSFPPSNLQDPCPPLLFSRAGFETFSLS